MDLNGLDTLKDKLVTAKDFTDPWEYFFDHFGDNPDFLKLGDKVSEPMLSAIVAKIGQQLFGEKAVTSEPLLVEIPERHFIHGSCFIQGNLTVIVFFSDIDMGLLAVMNPVPDGPETLLVRFSSYQMESDKVVSFAPTGSKSVH